MRQDPAHSCSCSGVTQYMKRTDVQERLGVDAQSRFGVCNNTINAGFRSSGDFHYPMVKYSIAALLERGVRALVYVGANDFACPWVHAAARNYLCVDH